MREARGGWKFRNGDRGDALLEGVLERMIELHTALTFSLSTLATSSAAPRVVQLTQSTLPTLSTYTIYYSVHCAVLIQVTLSRVQYARSEALNSKTSKPPSISRLHSVGAISCSDFMPFCIKRKPFSLALNRTLVPVYVWG